MGIIGFLVFGLVVGAVARLARRKRIDRLVEAVALLPKVHAVVAGDGELSDELRARAHELGISSRVHFLGWRSDVETVLGALDTFVVTSEREGMSNAMLEAMAAGVAIVSTPVSGAIEALAPDHDGRAPGIIASTEPQALADALDGVLAVRAVRLAMGAEGRWRAAGRFEFERMVDAWEGVLGGDHATDWHQGT